MTDVITLPLGKRERYERTSDSEKDAILTAYVLCGGNCARAARVLSEAGYPIGRQQVNERAQETERLERVREEQAPRLRAQLAEMHQGLAQAAGRIEAQAVERLEQKIANDELDGKDLSAVMQRASVSSGVHSDKHLLYSGQPTQIIQRPAEEVLRALKGKGIEFDYDLPAEEESPALSASQTD